MEYLVNEPFLKQRGKYARWGSYVGFAALLLGLLTTTRSTLLSYVFLLIGLLGASIGSYLANRYVKEPRADQVLAQAMESLDDRYTFYNYFLPAGHVVASHRGITVLEPRSQKGEIRYEGGRWRHKAGMRKLLQLFGEPSLGKPDQDLERNVGLTKEWIDKVMPEQDIPINGAIVFTDPEATLDTSDSPYPAIRADELPEHLTTGLEGNPILSTSKQKELRRTLDEAIEEG